VIQDRAARLVDEGLTEISPARLEQNFAQLQRRSIEAPAAHSSQIPTGNLPESSRSRRASRDDPGPPGTYKCGRCGAFPKKGHVCLYCEKCGVIEEEHVCTRPSPKAQDYEDSTEHEVNGDSNTLDPRVSNPNEGENREPHVDQTTHTSAQQTENNATDEQIIVESIQFCRKFGLNNIAELIRFYELHAENRPVFEQAISGAIALLATTEVDSVSTLIQVFELNEPNSSVASSYDRSCPSEETVAEGDGKPAAKSHGEMEEDDRKPAARPHQTAREDDTKSKAQPDEDSTKEGDRQMAVQPRPTTDESLQDDPIDFVSEERSPKRRKANDGSTAVAPVEEPTPTGLPQDILTNDQEAIAEESTVRETTALDTSMIVADQNTLPNVGPHSQGEPLNYEALQRGSQQHVEKEDDIDTVPEPKLPPS